MNKHLSCLTNGGVPTKECNHFELGTCVSNIYLYILSSYHLHVPAALQLEQIDNQYCRVNLIETVGLTRSLLNDHGCRAWVKICIPLPIMVTSPHETFSSGTKDPKQTKTNRTIINKVMTMIYCSVFSKLIFRKEIWHCCEMLNNARKVYILEV